MEVGAEILEKGPPGIIDDSKGVSWKPKRVESAKPRISRMDPPPGIIDDSKGVSWKPKRLESANRMAVYLLPLQNTDRKKKSHFLLGDSCEAVRKEKKGGPAKIRV